tara:strand:- start:1918 stop:2133 length:216 start_codon:yes stop_codon:yes gene_type:complete
MKERAITNAKCLIPQIVDLEERVFPVVRVPDLVLLQNEIETLEQECEDLPEGKEKEYCRWHLRKCYAALRG